jgi:hypothetical protein
MTDAPTYDENTLARIVDSVSPLGATPADKGALMMMARSTGLNPLVREVYLCKFSGKLQVVIGIDGWRRMARATGQYKSGHATYLRDAEGQVEACTYTVHTTDGGEFSFCVWLREFKAASPTWGRMPLHMLRIRAEVHCLKAAFGLSGMSEWDEDSGEVVAVQAQEQRRAALNRQLSAATTEPPVVEAEPVGVSEPPPAGLSGDPFPKLNYWMVAEELAKDISAAASAQGIEWSSTDAMRAARREAGEPGTSGIEVLKALNSQMVRLQNKAAAAAGKGVR